MFHHKGLTAINTERPEMGTYINIRNITKKNKLSNLVNVNAVRIHLKKKRNAQF